MDFEHGHWQSVPCDECDGKGFVVFDAFSDVVHLGLAKVGDVDTCPICGGDRELDRWVPDDPNGMTIERSKRKDGETR